MKKTTFIIISIFCIFMISTGCSSSGEKDNSNISTISESEDFSTISTFLLLKKEQEISSLWVSRYMLPSSHLSYTWNTFSNTDNTIKISNELTQYNTRLMENSYLVEFDNFSLYKITTNMRIEKQELNIGYNSEKKLTITFNINNLTQELKVIYQPAHFGLTEGIKQSGQKNGIARVIEIEYLKNGKFQAVIAIRY